MANTDHIDLENKINIFPAPLQAFLMEVFPMLTERECESFYWFSKGYSYSEIAEVMLITPRTVLFHIESCKRKFGCSSSRSLLSIYHCWVENEKIRRLLMQ